MHHDGSDLVHTHTHTHTHTQGRQVIIHPVCSKHKRIHFGYFYFHFCLPDCTFVSLWASRDVASVSKVFRKRPIIRKTQNSPWDRQSRVSQLWLNPCAIPVHFQYLFVLVKNFPLGRPGDTFLVRKCVAFPHFCTPECSVALVMCDSVWSRRL